MVYYWQDAWNIIWLLRAYVKNETEDLTENEKKEISDIISVIKREQYD